jgi:hypothetical protein
VAAPVTLALSALLGAVSGGGLDAAEACFDALDYECAEDQLVGVLAQSDSPRGEVVRARLLDAQLALARRDDARARAAVRALFAAAPDYVADRRLPPRLSALLDAERPAPPRRLAGFARIDATSLRLFGHDGDRWSEGLGVEVGGGVVLRARYELEVAVGFSDHRPRSAELEGLTLWSVVGGARLHRPAGPVVLHVGLSAGALHADAVGVTGADAYWCFLGQAPLTLSLSVWSGLALETTLAPSLLLTTDAARLAYSFLLPVTGGVRYGF